MDVLLTGSQDFMGMKIPIVLGGFGPDKRCICDKSIAEIHGQPEREIRRRITDNIKRFRETVDYIDLKQRVALAHTLNLLENLGYSKQSITQAQHIYLLSERGYAKLIKIMDTDLAWEVHDRLVDEYFQFRDQVMQQCILPENFADALRQLADNVEENLALKEKIEADEPKVKFAEAIMRHDGSIEAADLPKVLAGHGIEIGRTNLYKLLRRWGFFEYTEDKKNIATKKAVEYGLAIVEEKPYAPNKFFIGNNYKNYITVKGQKWILTKFKKEEIA